MLDPRIISALKKSPSGPEAVEAIKIRTAVGLAEPHDDPMVERIVPIMKATEFKGSILDVGCYGGWLYGYLGKPDNYTGIDIWEEGIQAAKELFPEGDFRVCDLFEFRERRDFVWCSQLSVLDKDVYRFHDKLLSLGDHGCIAYRRIDAEYIGENEVHGTLKVFRW